MPNVTSHQVTPLERQAATRVRHLFAAITHDRKLAILHFLIGGERNVGEIQAFLDRNQVHTSQLLRDLRMRGLVRVRRVAQCQYYSLDGDDIVTVLRMVTRVFPAKGEAAA